MSTTPAQPAVPEAPVAEIAVIGGTGFYSFLDDPVEHAVTTPYGDPSAPISVGTVAGRSVAFVPRHGPHHDHPPHGINYRANAWALRSLGVRQVLAPCAAGSLRADLGPGEVVVPDQLVDRTVSRRQSFVETGACHVPFADPYCRRLSDTVVAVDEGGPERSTPGDGRVNGRPSLAAASRATPARQSTTVPNTSKTSACTERSGESLDGEEFD